MKITLCEDNGRFNNGAVSLVILEIVQDGGIVIRIPYQADKTIAELYADVGKVAKVVPTPVITNKVSEVFPVEKIAAHEIPMDRFSIEREDIVKCVKLHPRDPEAGCELTVGNEYRVIDISKQKGVIAYYEVLDDKSDNKIRIPVMPDEIELVRKRVMPAPRKQVFEIIKRCDACGEVNSMELNGDNYECSCIKCKKFLSEKRNLVV